MEFEEDYYELLRDIMTSETIQNKSEAYAKAEALLNDQLTYTIMMAVLPALVSTAIGISGPVGIGFSLLCGLIGASSSFFWDARIAQIKGESFGIRWAIDPSGYVYEAVTSNRIEDAKVTAYYKMNLEDENRILWDASEYDQNNPLYTDTNGQYAWDVPEGYWQVDVELPGYDKWTSEWLPVPPIQTGINAGLISHEEPEVETINIYSDHVYIKFTKYMQPESILNIGLANDLKGGNIAYKLEYDQNQKDIKGKVYANEYNLYYTNETLQVGESCKVLIPDTVKSYSGSSYSGGTLIEVCKKNYKIVAPAFYQISYGSIAEIPVKIIPTDGELSVTAKSLSDDYIDVISMNPEETAGSWKLNVEGILPGETEVLISIPGTSIQTRIGISVIMGEVQSDCITDEHDYSVIETKEATCTEEGEIVYYCNRCGDTMVEKLSPLGHIGGNADCETGAVCTRCGKYYGETKNHTWESWKQLSAASVFQPATEKRTCSVCKKEETRIVGAKLKPTIDVAVTSFPLKVKQSYKLKVCGLAFGDYIVSWTSSNKKIASVNKDGKITGKKKGNVKITIRLASGLKQSIKVKVQKNAVKTKKIKNVTKKITLKKGKSITLKPLLSPVTSLQKVTYKSSDKRVATVTGKGVIKGKKTGKVKITVKSGSKKVTVMVKVLK